MATLVQTTPATTTRHSSSSQSYPIVRPSSSSTQQQTLQQRSQPLYLVSSASPQMYMQSPQQQTVLAVNYNDITRQAYQQQQQQAKQAQLQQRRSAPHQQHPGSPRQHQQRGIKARSRSDEALREKSHVHRSQVRSSVQSPAPPEAQSAPRPVSSAALRSPPHSTSLPHPPQILGSPPPRPSSADGASRPPMSVENYRARVYADPQQQQQQQQQRAARFIPLPSSPRDTIPGVYFPPPAVLGGYGIQGRYSAEDVSTLKNMGYQMQGYPGQQFSTPGQYPSQYAPNQKQYKPRAVSLQPAPHYQSHHPNSKSQPAPQPTFALPQQPPQLSPTRGQPSPTRPPPSPIRAQHTPVPNNNVRPQPSPQQSFVKPQQSPKQPPTVPQIPQQIPAIPQQIPPIPQAQHHQSSLPPHISRRDHRRANRPLSCPPNIKRSASSPELAPPQSSPMHRKSSSSSSTTSAASAPSQLETASTHSSIPSTNYSVPNSTIPQSEHTPYTPSPLGKLNEDDVLSLPCVNPLPPPIIPIVVDNKGKSFSSRLRRAFSFSGPSNITTSTSTPDLHAAAAAQTQPPEQGEREGEVDHSDQISISSTASSASVLIRSLSSGFKRSRKSIIGIFKGGSTRRRSRASRRGSKEHMEDERENKFPFEVPGEGSGDAVASVGVSYATAEGEISRESEDTRRKSTVFSEREAIIVKVSSSKRGKSSKVKVVEPTNLRGILKSILPKLYIIGVDKLDSDSRQSSFESLPNGSADSIPSIKATLLSADGDAAPVSDFAKSLASTLDSQISHLKAATAATSGNITPAASDTGTPTDEKSYFDVSAARQVATAPATPTGRTTPRRGIQFSPRLEVHETWHSAEYDRRGEPATCNRLTAQLAQMIKEELNAFKMEEMIVHEVPSP